MALTVAQRRVMRHTQESNYINTLNVADQVKIHFVWFPGPQTVANALIDPLITTPDASGTTPASWLASASTRIASRRWPSVHASRSAWR